MKLEILSLKIPRYLSFIICMMLMIVVPIWRDHKIFGINLSHESDDKVETLTILPDGNVIVNTTDICKKVMGYGGPTPVELTIKNGIIEKVKPLNNQETPEFFGAVLNSDMIDRYNGLTLEEAAQVRLDGVAGATYSSNALKENMKAAVAYALDSNIRIAEKNAVTEKLPLKFYITIVIIVAAGIIPLFLHDKRYRMLQMVLNVILLGFWGGTFISYSLMMSYLTNGITSVVLIPTGLMLIAAFIYPMFGKSNYYCLWMCPYGSIQELAGKCIRFKISLSPKVIKNLTVFRELLWFVLMWLLWTGLWFDWMGFEPFAAFFFTDASVVTLSIAGAFLILSILLNRPYCRFVCPTGSLFKFAEGSR